MEDWAVRSNREWSKLCPNKIENATLGGVPVLAVVLSNEIKKF
jgi:hypothetical protein